MSCGDSICEPLFAMEPALGIVDRVPFICSQVSGKTVLHIGCADYPLTLERMADPNFFHRRLAKVSQYCVGLDASKEALEAMSRAGFEHLIEGDACQLSLSIHEKFDCIVAGEVLEHLPNPGLFFAEAARCLKPGGAVFVTVPNAFNLLRIIHLFAGRESVHKDHCFYFSAKTLAHLAALYGFKLERIGYTDPLVHARWKPFFSWAWKFLVHRLPVLGQSVVAVLRFGDTREVSYRITR